MVLKHINALIILANKYNFGGIDIAENIPDCLGNRQLQTSFYINNTEWLENFKSGGPCERWYNERLKWAREYFSREKRQDIVFL